MAFSEGVTLNRIISFFEDDFADIRCQSSWDFSGRQIYLGDHDVTKVCLALDPSKEVIRQAIDRGCELLITHHPLFFQPTRGINITRPLDKAAIMAIRNGLSILSYHTNLDISIHGTNSYLLKLLGATDQGWFSPEGALEYVKLAVFVPSGHEHTVLDAIDRAGGGRVGNYRRCAFSVIGTGTFTPLEGSNPFIGMKNSVEEVVEVRLEVLVPADITDYVVAAMKAAHPYEVPAFDVVSVKSPEEYGMGRIGELKKDYSYEEFIALLKRKLKIKELHTNMESRDEPVRRFAVCTGSGGGLWKDCLRHDISTYITGDLKHHDALDARQAGIWVTDIGHFNSEKIYMNHLAGILRERFATEVFVAQETPSILSR